MRWCDLYMYFWAQSEFIKEPPNSSEFASRWRFLLRPWKSHIANWQMLTTGFDFSCNLYRHMIVLHLWAKWVNWATYNAPDSSGRSLIVVRPLEFTISNSEKLSPIQKMLTACFDSCQLTSGDVFHDDAPTLFCTNRLFLFIWDKCVVTSWE